ncbi:putative short-chain dehydrogenase [Aspergillus recurvatus]
MSSGKPLVLITGANQGIGFAAAQILASTGKYHLLIGARSQPKAEAAVQQLLSLAAAAAATPLVIDVADDASILAAAKLVTDRFGSLDILINNAGISGQPEQPGLTLREKFHQVFDVNVFGVAAVTAAFLPLLRASKYHDRRIVNVTTGLGHIGMALSPTSDYNIKAWALPVYRSSKTALNMITAVDAVTLAEEGISAILAAPGFTRTNFTGGHGVKDASEGAKEIVRAATEGNPGDLVGKVVDAEHTLEEFGW